MIPAYIVRVGIDTSRRNPEFNGLNPCARCEAGIKTVTSLYNEKIGPIDPPLIESATAAAYFAEFLHSTEPLPDEVEWREILTKQSGKHDSFESWEKWFKNRFADLFQDDDIWIALMMTSFAYTHEYELVYTEDAWEFRPITAYLRTEHLLQLQPHLGTIAEILHHIWQQEVSAYQESDFVIDEYKLPYLGKIECLGFDTKKYELTCPPSAHRPKEELDVGALVADIVFPTIGNGYRKPDPMIFSGNHIDVTSLTNRADYFFKSMRRLHELSLEGDVATAGIRASAEGWLATDIQSA